MVAKRAESECSVGCRFRFSWEWLCHPMIMTTGAPAPEDGADVDVQAAEGADEAAAMDEWDGVAGGNEVAER